MRIRSGRVRDVGGLLKKILKNFVNFESRTAIELAHQVNQRNVIDHGASKVQPDPSLVGQSTNSSLLALSGLDGTAYPIEEHPGLVSLRARRRSNWAGGVVIRMHALAVVSWSGFPKSRNGEGVQNLMYDPASEILHLALAAGERYREEERRHDFHEEF
jgi:hypothetical protein